MKRKSLAILFVLSTLLSAELCAQVAMGGWRTHFAYNSVTQIAQTENKVYAVSNGALFSIDKLDNNVEIYSKITGLNGTVVSTIKYDNVNKQLVVGYNNGNIDLITSGGIINIPDFYNKVMTVDKSINHINIHNNKAYLSCHFGIIVLNLQRREISETYYIGPNASEVDVMNTTVHNNEIYALTYTPVGAKEAERQYTVFKANINNSNLVNYENWSRLSNLPGTATHQCIAAFSNHLFIQSDWKLYRYEENAWTPFVLPGGAAVAAGISVSANKMIVANESANIYIIDENLNVQHLSGIVQYARTGEYDAAKDTYWFAGGEFGVTSYHSQSGQTNQIKPDGPFVNIPFDLTFAGEKLFMVPGGRWASQQNAPGYVMIYENETWITINGVDIKAQIGAEVLDFMNTAIDPADNTHFFVTSYGTGLYEFRGNKFHARYLTEFESAAPNDPQRYTRLDGAVFDSEGNLFVANSSALSGGIRVFQKNGTWTNLSYPKIDYAATLGKIIISNKNPNQKWIISLRSESRGVGVFDDNGTIEDQKDDRSKFMNSLKNSDNPEEEINPAYWYCIAQDLDGTVWVGTDVGPLLFHNPENVFNDGYTCSRVKISRNDGTNQADYLLAEEGIKAIAIDGANRKWIGTVTSGIYLLSEDGQETIHHFTTDNSPLLSNEILSIAINPISGEVFIGTSTGLISYQSDAAAGNNTFQNVYAYPNPVRENFNGIITITGLVTNTQVKITDLNGNLICETVSNGSIATWDGKDAFGRKVSTGIYLALCITEDGSDSTITKIMVIN